MTDERDQPPLTAAAVQTLDEFLSAVRREILDDAARRAADSMSGAPVEVTVRDVVAAAENSTRTQSPRGDTRDARERILRLYVRVFLATSVVGVMLWLGPDLKDLSSQAQIGLATTVTGMVGALLASSLVTNGARIRFGPAHLGTSSVSFEELTGQFIREYNVLELDLRDLLARTLGESAAGERTPTLTALKSGALSSDLADELRLVVDVRNRLVHGKPVKTDELRSGMRSTQRLRDHLRDT